MVQHPVRVALIALTVATALLALLIVQMRTHIPPPMLTGSAPAVCHLRGPLPDPVCSPGVALPGVTRDQVCRPGYATDARNVPAALKSRVYAEYGVTAHSLGVFEVDHIVPLSAGGSNDLKNLFPEPAEPRPGFHEKDRLEAYIHREVCAGRLPLADAQRRIATDWLTFWEAAGRP